MQGLRIKNFGDQRSFAVAATLPSTAGHIE